MKKLLTVVVGVAASLGMAFCLTGCWKNTPEEVVVAYFKEMANVNYEGAAKYATKNEAEKLNNYAKELAASPRRLELRKEKAKGAKFEVIGKAEITGDKATVKMKLADGKGKEEERDVNLVKEDGNWKVSFH